MKKITCYLLSLVFVFSSLATLIIGGPAASASGTDDPYFETNTNWGLYANTTIDGNGPQVGGENNWCKIATNTDTAYVKAGSTSLKIEANCFLIAVPLQGLEKDTIYTLSFYYRSPSASNNNMWFRDSGIYRKGSKMDAWGWPNKTETPLYVTGADGTNAYHADGSWEKYSITFTADGSELYFGFNYQTNGSSVLYLDDFKLEYDNNYFETNTNWGLYANTTIDGNGPQVGGDNNWCKITTNTDTAYVKAGGSSLKIEANCFLIAVPLQGLEKDITYTLSFYYRSPSASNNNMWFRDSGIYRKGSKMDAWGWPNKTETPLYVTGADGTDAYHADGSWKKYSITFTADGSELYFGFNYQTNGSSVLYLDDFSLTSNVTDHSLFENVSNWGLYIDGCDKNEGCNNTINGNAPTIHGGWSKITSNTNLTYVKSGNTSIKLFGNCVNFALPLGALERGYEYTLTFYYYAPSGSTKFADTNSWLDHIGIVEAGTKVDQWGYPKNFFAKGENATGDVAVWNKHTITFTADDSELFFTLRLCLGGDYTVYLDEFDLERSGGSRYFDTPASWGIYNADGVGTIDGTGPVFFQNWHKVVTNTDAQFIKEGNTTSLKLLGNCVTYAVELFDLENGKDYTLSFYYYVPAGSTDYKGTWFDNAGILKKGTSIDRYGYPENLYVSGEDAGGETGVWHKYTLSFKATDEDLFFGLRMCMNGGYTMYINEMSLTEGLDPNHRPLYDNDFETADNWGIYNSEVTPAIDGSGSTRFQNWAYIKRNTDPTYIKDGNVSLDIHGNCAVYAIPLTGLKAGTGYTLSFYYYPPKTSEVFRDYQSWFDNTGIFRTGTAVDQYGYPADAFVLGENACGKADEWTKYTISFMADGSDLFFGMRICMNAGYTIYLDDFTLDEIPAGFIEDTKLSFCEDYYNLAKNNGMPSKATIQKPTTYKIPITAGGFYTFGTDIAGKGDLVISSDQDGKEVLYSKQISEKETRIGVSLWIPGNADTLYLHFIPKAESRITIKDPCLFVSKAVSLGYDMGKAERVHLPDIEYHPIKVNGDYFPDEAPNALPEQSPATGDGSVTGAVLLVVLALLALVSCLSIRRKKRID